MNSLAKAYRGAGKLDQAFPLCEKTLALRRAALGPDNPETLTSINNLALAYSSAGKLNEALALCKETYALMNARLGSEHPAMLDREHELAIAYWAAGNLNEALPLLENTLNLKRTKLGKTDPDTLDGMSNLAEASFSKAESLLRESIALLESQKSDDWTIFKTRSLLGSALLEQKKYNDAKPLLVAQG